MPQLVQWPRLFHLLEKGFEPVPVLWLQHLLEEQKDVAQGTCIIETYDK
jgi:hypothetical protein